MVLHISLQQVAVQLLSNALKFTPAGGHVQVRVEEAPDGTRLTVEDDGMGMDADFLPQAFDRFRLRDASTTRSRGGLGVGLALVRHLVELHGGRVTAESAGADQGTRIVVTLPRALGAASASLHGE